MQRKKETLKTPAFNFYAQRIFQMDSFTFPLGPCGGSALQIAGDAALILLQLLPLLRSAHLVYSLTHWRHDRTKAACGPITALAGTKDCTSKTDFLLPTTYFLFFFFFKKEKDRIIEIKCPVFHLTVFFPNPDWSRGIVVIGCSKIMKNIYMKNLLFVKCNISNNVKWFLPC